MDFQESDHDNQIALPVKVSNKLRKVLCNVSDHECAIYEFVNEESSLKIGFLAWMKLDVKLVDDLISASTETKIYWPVACPIVPANKIKRNLTVADFEEHVVIVKAHGEWTAMKSKMKSYQETGSLDISKGSRKNFRRKIDESPTAPVLSKSKKGKALKQITQELYDKQVKETEYLKSNIWEDDSSIGDSSDHEQGFESNKSPKHSASQKKSSASNKAKGLKKNALSMEDTCKSKRSSSIKGRKYVKPYNPDEQETSDTDEHQGGSPPKKTKFTTMPPKIKVQTKKGTQDTPLEKSGDLSDDSGDGLYKANSTVLAENRSNLNANKKTTSTEIKPVVPDYLDNKTSLPPGIKNAVPLSKTILSNIPRKTIQGYVSGLMDNFFTQTYLAEHSPTGQPINANKNMVPKPALDPVIVRYIREECVEKVFGAGRKIQSKVTKAMSDKISAARSALKGKGAIKDENIE